MTRILLDVDVVLDVLLNRAPHAEAASRVWTFVEEGRVEGFLSAHAVTTLHYLNGRAVSSRAARRTTESLLTVFGVAAVDQVVIRSAVAMAWTDFEDAVTAAAAERARCGLVVTRNVRDYRRSPVPALTPADAAAWLEVA